MNIDKSASAMTRTPAFAEGGRTKRGPAVARFAILEKFSSLDGGVLLTEVEAAAIAGVSAQFLAKERLKKGSGRGPSPTYFYGLIRYRVSAVRDWLDGFSTNAA